MRAGIDRLHALPHLVRSLRSRRVALLAHPASVDRHLVHTHRVLLSLGVRPRTLFGPEHGYGGEAQDMIGVDHAVDPETCAPIISLYGDSFDKLSPSAEALRDHDALLVDLADVGSRYYTFVWTALLAIRAALRAGMQCVVLDRPNPIGGTIDTVEGQHQKPGFLSFVGLEPVPIRHALTLGEMIAELCARDGVSVGPDRQVEVVAVDGWERHELGWDWDRPFVYPSPNMPTVDTALVYPGGCLLEGTNLSEGRGTTRPFEVLGAPWLDGVRLARELAALDLPGYVARPLTFQPMFHKHAGQVCGGVQIHVTDARRFRPVATYLAVLAIARRIGGDQFRFRTERYEFVDDIPAIDLLLGSSDAREAMVSGQPVERIIEMVCPVDTSYAETHARAVARVLDSARSDEV